MAGLLNPTFTELQAYNKGGFREKYAMEHGTRTEKRTNGRTLWVYKYSAKDEYQDANGATYDATQNRWVN